MCCSEGGDVHAHLGTMQKLRLELAGMKHPFNEMDYMSMLQQSMPDSYHNFMSAILTSAQITKVKITPDKMITHLTAKHDIREALKTKPQKMAKLGGSALVITSEGQRNRSNKGGGQKKNRNNSKIVWDNCGKRNHKGNDCWREGGGKEGQGPWQQKKKEKEKEQNSSGKPTPSASVASYNYAFCTSDFSHIAAKFNIPADRKQSAIVDCGATTHFTSLHQDLINYRTIENTDIKAADGHSFAAIGGGDLPIDLPNGSGRMSVILKDVLYAPSLMFALISVPRLDKAGYSTVLENGFCTISSPKPERKIITRIAYSNGLY